jgi:hypothetical protein
MKIEINDKKYYVKFKHIRKTTTICNIISQDKNTIGVSTKHPKDNFNKERGRKISLTRALITANLNKEERKEFWKVYGTWGKKRF